MSPEKSEVIERTRRWISSLVIGMNVCPFAKRVFDAGTIRFVESEVKTAEELVADLAVELKGLDAVPPEMTETTLLILPHALKDFYDFNDFLDIADALVRDLGFSGVFQIASFHPQYQFAGTPVDAVENYTNRSPYPMLHILREASISQLKETRAELDEIPIRNVALLNRLGRDHLLAKLEIDGALPE